MTNDQINVEIARCCGWEKDRTGAWISPDGFRDVGEQHIMPDYCTDLNAMAQAVMTLTDEQERNDFMEHLNEIACVPGDYGWHELNATSFQRAKAFLRVKGLWRDDTRSQQQAFIKGVTEGE